MALEIVDLVFNIHLCYIYQIYYNPHSRLAYFLWVLVGYITIYEQNTIYITWYRPEPGVSKVAVYARNLMVPA